MIKVCVQCKQEFNPSSRHAKCSRCRKKYHKCLDCDKQIRIEWLRCIKCRNIFYTKRGPENILFKNKHYTKRGYVKIYCPDHPKVQRKEPRHRYLYEHVIIMEAHLGRFLINGENVHHKNGIKNDNRIENLELWVRPQPSGIKVNDAINHAIETLKKYAPEYLNQVGSI